MQTAVTKAMRCPITLESVDRLSNPVAFYSSPDQPYELSALCQWLELSCTNPLTGNNETVRDLILLGSADQRRESMEMLSKLSLTIDSKQVFKIKTP